MAGVKGRSGGPRPNSGGKRLGAGRKRKQPQAVPETTGLQFLLDVMHGRIDPTAAQLRAAIVVARIEASQPPSDGKKVEPDDTAPAGGITWAELLGRDRPVRAQA